MKHRIFGIVILALAIVSVGLMTEPGQRAARAAGDLTFNTFYWDSGASTPLQGMASNAALKWANATSGGDPSSATFDAGLVRSAANVVKATDGSSGNGKFQAASVGPSATQQHTLPAVTSDTVAVIAASQTLTNKTLTAPTIQGAVAAGSGLTMPVFTAGGVETFGTGLGAVSQIVGPSDQALQIASGAGRAITLAPVSGQNLNLTTAGAGTTVINGLAATTFPTGLGAVSQLVGPSDQTFQLAAGAARGIALAPAAGQAVTLANTASRPVGFNALSTRYELKWIAGARGLVTVNGSVLFSTDSEFELLGTNAVAGDVTYYADGGLLLASHGAQNDSSIILPRIASSTSAWTGILWGADEQVEWEALIQTTASVANEQIWAGLKLTNTPAIATDADDVFFEYDSSVAAFWQTAFAIATVDTTATTASGVAVNTQYHLKITIDGSRVARMYVNGVLLTTSTALTASAEFIPYIGVKAITGAAVKSVRVHGQAISRVIS